MRTEIMRMRLASTSGYAASVFCRGGRVRGVLLGSAEPGSAGAGQHRWFFWRERPVVFSIDADGVLASVEREEDQQAARRARQGARGRAGHLQQPAELRKISLRGLIAAIDDCRQHNRPLPDDVKYLAGLQRFAIRLRLSRAERHRAGRLWRRLEGERPRARSSARRPAARSCCSMTCWSRCDRRCKPRKGVSRARSIPRPKVCAAIKRR